MNLGSGPLIQKPFHYRPHSCEEKRRIANVQVPHDFRIVVGADFAGDLDEAIDSFRQNLHGAASEVQNGQPLLYPSPCCRRARRVSQLHQHFICVDVVFHQLVIVGAGEQAVDVDLPLPFDVDGPPLLVGLVVAVWVELLHLLALWELEGLTKG